MKPSLPLKCGLAVLLAGPAWGDTDTEQLLSPDLDRKRPRVAVTDTLVSLDGAPRADLGRSFSDGLMAALLKSARFEVIDAEAHATLNDRQPAVDPLRGSPDFVFVPTVIGQAEFYRVTMKKIALPSGRVDAVIEETGAGSMPRMFALANRVVEQLAPASRPAVGGQSPKIALEPVDESLTNASSVGERVPPVMRTEQPRPLRPPPAIPAPMQLRSNEKPMPKAMIVTKIFTENREKSPEEVGRVSLANAAYSFCVIDPDRGRRLQPGDRVAVRVQNWVRPTLAATVTRIERGHAIAEYSDVSTPLPPHVAQGARVYRWIEPDAKPGGDLGTVPRALPAPEFIPPSF